MGTYHEGIAAQGSPDKSVSDTVLAALAAAGFTEGSIADRTLAYFRSLNVFDDPDCASTSGWTATGGSLAPVLSKNKFRSGGTSIKCQAQAVPTVPAFGHKTIAALLPGAGIYTATSWVYLGPISAEGQVGIRISGTGVVGGDVDVTTNTLRQWVRLSNTFEYDGVGTCFIRAIDLAKLGSNVMFIDSIAVVPGAVGLPLEASMADYFRAFLGITPDPLIDPSELS